MVPVGLPGRRRSRWSRVKGGEGGSPGEDFFQDSQFNPRTEQRPIPWIEEGLGISSKYQDFKGISIGFKASQGLPILGGSSEVLGTPS